MDPLYPDCVFPHACECRQRLPPGSFDLHERCVVPAVNATADKLGWRRPYPDVEARSDPA